MAVYSTHCSFLLERQQLVAGIVPTPSGNTTRTAEVIGQVREGSGLNPEAARSAPLEQKRFKALPIANDEVLDLIERARMLSIQGKYNEAHEGIRRAIDLNQNKLELFLSRAKASFDKGEGIESTQEGLGFLKKAVSLNKCNENALTVKGKICFAQGRREEAYKFWECANINNPHPTSQVMINEGIAYLEQGKCVEAHAIVNRALDLIKNKIIEYAEKGDACCHNGKYSEGSEFFNQAYALDQKNNTFAFLAKGRIYIKEHRYDEAHKFLDLAYMQEPRSVAILINKCIAYLGQREYAKGLEWIKEAQRLAKATREGPLPADSSLIRLERECCAGLQRFEL